MDILVAFKPTHSFLILSVLKILKRNAFALKNTLQVQLEKKGTKI